jgi:tripartite-type tricarboxylate transporter receptor subunit TctC
VTDLLAGTLDAALVNIGAAAAQVNAGTLRGLCVSSAERVPALPGVPSILESGLLREAVVGWHGIVAPRDTPVPVLETIDAAVQAALPELAPRLRVLGVEPVREAPARLQALIRTDAARWGALILRPASRRPGDPPIRHRAGLRTRRGGSDPARGRQRPSA